MDAPSHGFVEILREFLAVDEALRRLVARYSSSELAWDDVRLLVTDEEGSPLYRLKERTHTLFRTESGDPHAVRHREVLFDLAIGSLFHEAMKFRENFYQREVYGPRVRALHREAGREAEGLFAEFEKILEAGSERLDESVAETSALLDRSREQLIDLLSRHGADGYVARLLIEQREVAERVFSRDLDDLFGEIYGESSAAWDAAGRSYVASGYFGEGRGALVGAVERGADRAAVAPWIAYSDGMAAYMRGDYAESITELGRWSKARDGESDAALVLQACAALSRVDRLVRDEGRDSLIARAEEVVAELS